MNLLEQTYGNRLRVRVCGILIEEDKILLVKHKGLGKKGELWLPPGGGMDVGSDAKENLIREFKEEVGIEIEVLDFLFIHEHFAPPLHAIELFFSVIRKSGNLKLGLDPEFPSQDQIITDAKFFNYQEVHMLGLAKLHQVFKLINSLKDLVNLSGYFKF